MDNSVVAAIGLVATVAAVVSYVFHRRHDGEYLRRDAALAASLRTLADGDPVRLAAVDEFETTVYRRLFGASVVGPRAVAAAWALLATVLSVAGAVLVEPRSGVVADVAFWLVLVLAVVFGVALMVFVVATLHAVISVPRIAFDDPYAPAVAVTADAEEAPSASAAAD